MSLLNGVSAPTRAQLGAAVRLAWTTDLTDRSALEALLYTTWFAGAPASSYGPGAAAEWPIVPQLRAAHAASAWVEPGWVARQIGPDGSVLAERDGEVRVLGAADYLSQTSSPGMVHNGDLLTVTARRDGQDSTGGWWITWGTTGEAPPAMVRLYWNCPPIVAPALVAGITGILEQRRVRYTLKCPTFPSLFLRVEPVVLYLGFTEWDAVKGELRGLHQLVAPQLRPAVPPLTLPIGRGVAVAEDPGGGRSFGESRAAAVADGLRLAASLGVTGLAPTVAVITSRLPAHDISPARPYLRWRSSPQRVTAW